MEQVRTVRNRRLGSEAGMALLMVLMITLLIALVSATLVALAMGEYQAVGCAGHSHRAGRRFWNVRTPERYIDAVTSGASPVAAGEELDAEGRQVEALQLALRTRDGVPASSLPVDELSGLVEVDGDRLVLTTDGRLLANEVALRLRTA